MMTAVQNRLDEHCFAKVVLGLPAGVVPGRRGDIWLFSQREIVAFLIRANRRRRLFVFRTLERPEPGTTEVPGVLPAVRLLLVAYTARRIYRAQRLLRLIEKRDVSPSALDDSFYLRAATTLASRVPVEHIVSTLLEEHGLGDPQQQVSPAAATHG